MFLQMECRDKSGTCLPSPVHNNLMDMRSNTSSEGSIEKVQMNQAAFYRRNANGVYLTLLIARNLLKRARPGPFEGKPHNVSCSLQQKKEISR